MSAWCRHGSPTWRSRVPIPKDFKIVRTKCRNAVLQISGGCTVDVAFAPKEAGHRSATVVVATDTGQYTSVLVDGDSHYTPAIQAAGTDVIAGQQIGVGGSGFAPNATITLLWADGAGRQHDRPSRRRRELLDLDARRRPTNAPAIACSSPRRPAAAAIPPRSCCESSRAPSKKSTPPPRPGPAPDPPTSRRSHRWRADTVRMDHSGLRYGVRVTSTPRAHWSMDERFRRSRNVFAR